METSIESNDLVSTESKTAEPLSDVKDIPDMDGLSPKQDVTSDPLVVTDIITKPKEEPLDQIESQNNTSIDTKLDEKDLKSNESLVEFNEKTEQLNGSVVSPKLTRNTRNTTQLTPNPTINAKPEVNPNEQRLTRSRYGRLQKAKTPNPEMITFEVKRRSSIKSNDSLEITANKSPQKVDNKTKDSDNLLNESTNRLRKSKRKISETPKDLSPKKKTTKLGSDSKQTKSNANEVQPTAQTPTPKKVAKEAVPQKKCIELTGDPTSAIVDRYVLITIPPQEGDYSVGDLIWAKVSGYPWWPCMVSLDPITALYSKISGVSYKAGRVYHVQYFGPQALRGWTSVGQVMPFEGREKYFEKLEALKNSSPKAKSTQITAKYAIKASLKKQWDQSVEEAEEASKMMREDRVRSLTFEYTLSSKTNSKRKSETSFGTDMDSKRKKLSVSSPEDIYDFDDDADTFNISHSTPGLMWRKRVQKGDFAVYVERHYEAVLKENPSLNRHDLEDMLQKRWDLLGEDLRSLYTDRKFVLNNTNELTDGLSTPKPVNNSKPKTDSPNRKTKSSRKSKAKQSLPIIEDQIDSNESDSERNLVIAETPVKKSAPKKSPKSSNKSNAQSLSTSSQKASNSVKKSETKSTQKKTQNKPIVKLNPKTKKSIEKPVDENGVNDKPIAQNTDQSLVHFGIDYSDEFTSSEDTSSTSEPEAIDSTKGFDKFCVVCNDSENSETLIACQGSCLQMFHKKCAKYEGTDGQFKCIECETGKHKCFVCKSDEPIEGNDTINCGDSKCGKYYHICCLEKGFPIKMSELKDSFVCPLHYCLNCHIESQNDKDFRPSRRRLVKCISCPTAYHLGDYCIAAGTVQVSQNHVICPDHHEKRKKDRHVNLNYCFSCLTGGELICCESCPAAFHTTCLDYTLDPESNFYCGDCTARKPLHYGDVVWVKLGFYRWWPGKVCHPKAVPDNVMKLPHGIGEFPVYFFGSHDYYWVHRGRVFLFMEGDNKVAAANSGGKKSSKSLLKTFKLATEEAAEQFKGWQESKIAIRRAMGANKPPPYIHIRSNKPIDSKVPTNTDESHISLCECKVKNESACIDDNCINRALMVECDPKLCRAGDQCKNQRFKKREYVLSKPFKTDTAGWGLRALEDIKKGQFVIEYVGELIDEEECERRLNTMGDNNQMNFYFLTIDKDKIIDAGPKGNLARFMNHSCQPNCETQKWMVNASTRVGLFAVCDIPTGSELTFNYNLDCRGNEKTKCVCGSANCSGFIGVRPNKTEDNQNKKSTTNGQNSKKKKKKQEKKDFSKMHEDDCFTCGEGGDLIMCDRKGCPKSYHLECLKLTQIPKGKWECPRHFCDTCGKAATALCAFCPTSLCQNCAIPSRLTQLPEGGLLCSDHTNQDMNGLLEPEVKSTDIDTESARKESNELEESEDRDSSKVFDTTSESITTSPKNFDESEDKGLDL